MYSQTQRQTQSHTQSQSQSRPQSQRFSQKPDREAASTACGLYGSFGTSCLPPRHHCRACPECGGLLKAGKDPVDSERGFRYRERRCLTCGVVVYTKQPPEEVTGIESPTATA